MTKEKMLNLIDKLIKDEEEAIKNYNKAILDLQDSPGITRELGYIYAEESRHLTQLNELKLKVENYDPEKEKAAVKMLISMKADAIIVASCSEYIKETIKNCPIPVVSLDAMWSGPEVAACIHCDYQAGGRMAAEHLIEKGCRNIVCIKGPQYRYSARYRYQGYLDVCREQNIPEQTVECDYDFNQGLTMTEELLKKYPEVDGIIACNDIVAISTYKVLYEQNISVPGQVQIVGFDNISFSKLLSPELTTIIQPIKEMAEKAVELIANNELTELSDKKFIFPVSLIARQTTK
jgi:DNA-binding LacI/PurR family transcriptional regulator